MNDAIETLPLTKNRLLSAMPKEELGALRPHFVPASFKPGTILAQPGDAIRNCYFPSKGMVSLLSVTEQGNSVEIGFIGLEGMVGIPVVLGKNEMPYEVLVQTDSDCLAANAAAVLELFNRGGAFHYLVLQYTYALFKQVSQTCICNHFHTIEARLCRWLTVMCERSANTHLSLTQEFLARMLGVQRTSVGLIANSMQRAGMIRYSRGRIEIVDLDRIRASACECFFIVKKEYGELYASR
jgi:CRP-like cAMP-binding protein